MQTYTLLHSTAALLMVLLYLCKGVLLENKRNKKKKIKPDVIPTTKCTRRFVLVHSLSLTHTRTPKANANVSSSAASIIQSADAEFFFPSPLFVFGD
jgi:hypothetical protein